MGWGQRLCTAKFLKKKYKDRPQLPTDPPPPLSLSFATQRVPSLHPIPFFSSIVWTHITLPLTPPGSTSAAKTKLNKWWSLGLILLQHWFLICLFLWMHRFYICGLVSMTVTEDICHPESSILWEVEFFMGCESCKHRLPIDPPLSLSEQHPNHHLKTVISEWSSGGIWMVLLSLFQANQISHAIYYVQPRW